MSFLNTIFLQHSLPALRCFLLAGLLVALVMPAAGQTDSAFVFKTFDRTDIVPFDPESDKTIDAANRLPEHVDELPARTYIITKEEIIRNGYSTLVDALKYIPGFRTSQPGSALMGESFLMRGLVGNVHCKILVNGIPVKPLNVAGMPLAAQLPIRQAERIEIIMGPGSSVFGSDAMAGVINIVLPTIERPVEVVASVQRGTGSDDEVHLSLGGKLGRNRNIFKYNFFASSRQVKDVALKLDSTHTTVDSMATSSPFYVPSSSNLLTPEIRELGHNSRLLGIELQFRGLSLTSQSMYRLDHAAVGSSPGIIAYHNPSNVIADRIHSNGLQYRAEIGDKLNLLTNVSYLIYELDNNSQYTGIGHPLSNGTNFVYASSNDFFAEQLARYSIDQLQLLAGGSVRLASGRPYLGHLNNPFNPDRFELDDLGEEFLVNSSDEYSNIDSLVSAAVFSSVDAGVFLQGFYKLEKVNILAGARIDKLANFSAFFSPKLGFVYKIKPNLRLRASYAQAYNGPSDFYREHNYTAFGATGRNIQMTQTTVGLSPEELTTIEGGINWQPKAGTELSLYYFTHTLKNGLFMRQDAGPDPNFVPGQPPAPRDFYIGYENHDASSTLHSIQASGSTRLEFMEALVSVQYNQGTEALPADTVNRYREVPDFQATINVHFIIKKTWHLTTLVQAFGPSLGSVELLNGEFVQTQNESYANVDLVAAKTFSPRFQAQARVINVLNTVSRGLHNRYSPGRPFQFIPQTARVFSIALTYQLR